MRRAILLALGIVAAAVVAMLLLTANGKASRTAEGARDAKTPTVATSSSPAAFSTAGAPRTRVSIDAPVRAGRQVRPSSRERRSGESDADYQMRLFFLGEYESFVRDAKLTEAQQEQMLAALADMQEQAVLTHEEMWQSHLDVKARGGDLKDQILSNPGRYAFVALRDELLARGREFLDPQQYERLKGGMLASSTFPYLARTIEFFEISYDDE